MKRRARLAAGAASAAAALAAPLEGTMLTHMLVQLPLLAAAGWLLAGRLSLHPLAARCDRHGLTGLTALLLVSAYWMIPRVLELALTDPAWQAAKIVSVFALGALLHGSLRRAGTILGLFFVGNFSSMTAIAGMLYQDMPQRLCNAYGLDDQIWTGRGLVAAALLFACAWCVAAGRRHGYFDTQKGAMPS